MADAPRKPTGQLGHYQVTTEKGEFIPIAFPRTKEEIEEYIVKSFLKEAQHNGVVTYKVTNLRQNELDDFDYRLETSEGEKYMELREIAPLEHLRGAHTSAPSSYNEYDFADYSLKKALGKSARYMGSTDKPITLLMYVTHWAFLIGPTVRALLQFWFLREEHCFERVYFYCPIRRQAQAGPGHGHTPRCGRGCTTPSRAPASATATIIRSSVWIRACLDNSGREKAVGSRFRTN